LRLWGAASGACTTSSTAATRGLLKCNGWKPFGRRKPHWLIYRVVMGNLALRWILALRMVIKKIPGWFLKN